MLAFLTLIVRFLGLLVRSKHQLIVQNLILTKENEILKRHRSGRPIRTKQRDRVFFVLLNGWISIKDKLSIFRPETLLKWQAALIRSYWTYPASKRRVGRPPVSKEIKDLILSMKNANPTFFGSGHIQGELRKIGIDLAEPTIRRILAQFRKQGMVKTSLSWKKFLTMQIESIYAMDFFTVDTFRGERYYVHFIIKHATRQIVQFAITQNPIHNFVRQQILLFSERFTEKTTATVKMIHDNGGEFFDLGPYGIESVWTSIGAPDMNSIAERFVRTVRQECLDWFFIFNEKQLKGILTEFINHYNARRPHQGLAQDSPLGYEPQTHGRIVCKPVLSGLFNDYCRRGGG